MHKLFQYIYISQLYAFSYLCSHYFHVYYNIDSLSKPKETGEKISKQSISAYNDDNILLNPSTNAHIILIHESLLDLDTAIATYINEGLKRGQLCIHASVSLANDGYLDNFSTRITNYEENLEKGNLILVDMASYYVNIMVPSYIIRYLHHNDK